MSNNNREGKGRGEAFDAGAAGAHEVDFIGAYEKVTGLTFQPTARRPLSDAEQRRDDWLEDKAENRKWERENPH